MLQLFTDGGVIGPNPSPLGGTWAWCLVVNNDRIAYHASGIVTPKDIGLPTVSNNVTELLAAVEGLDNAVPQPVDWFTDSGVTLWRLTTGKKWAGVPDWLKARAIACRPGVKSATLLGGHPNKAELASGRRKDGKPVSEWNVWCDHECNRLAAEFRAKAGAA